jgi:peptidoglycan/LPS O-acetylase OafA/YrhL
LALVFVERQWGWWCPGLVRVLGETSFSTYLSSLFTLALVGKAVQATGLFAIFGHTATRTLLVVSALGGGVLTGVFIERPLHACIMRWMERNVAGGLLSRGRPS